MYKSTYALRYQKSSSGRVNNALSIKKNTKGDRVITVYLQFFSSEKAIKLKQKRYKPERFQTKHFET